MLHTARSNPNHHSIFHVLSDYYRMSVRLMHDCGRAKIDKYTYMCAVDKYTYMCAVDGCSGCWSTSVLSVCMACTYLYIMYMLLALDLDDKIKSMNHNSLSCM